MTKERRFETAVVLGRRLKTAAPWIELRDTIEELRTQLRTPGDRFGKQVARVRKGACANADLISEEALGNLKEELV